MQRARGMHKFVLGSAHRRVADARRYPTRALLRSGVVALIWTIFFGTTLADVTEQADSILAKLTDLQKVVDSARTDGVFFSAEMPALADLHSLVGLKRDELSARLGPGRTCTEEGKRECLLWAFYWKPFSTKLAGASPALVAIFDMTQRCVEVNVATME
jgi:hypothetical protein